MEVNGFQHHQTVATLCKKFGVSARQAEKYLARAREMMQRHDVAPIEEKRRQWEAMAMNAYREGLRIGDVRAAIGALEFIAKINGLGGVADMFERLLQRFTGESTLDQKTVEGLHKLRERMLQRAGRGDVSALQQAEVLTHQMVRAGLALEGVGGAAGKTYTVLEASPDCPAWPGNGPPASDVPPAATTQAIEPTAEAAPASTEPPAPGPPPPADYPMPTGEAADGLAEIERIVNDMPGDEKPLNSWKGPR